MKKNLLIVFLLVFSCSVSYAQFLYPHTKTVKVSDNYWGKTVQDPYRWIEDLKDSSVLKWFRSQADYTNTQMKKIPNQDKVIKELKVLDQMTPDDIFPIQKAGGRYFYRKRFTGEQASKLYYRQGKTGKEILLFDPQKYKKGKTVEFVPIVSDDGSKIIMNLSESGTELGDVRILDVATASFLPDLIAHSSSSGFAHGSNTQILYSLFKGYDVHDPENNLNIPLKLHSIGTPPERDIVLVSSQKNPELNILPREYPIIQFSKNSSYMVLGKYTVERNLTLYYAPKDELLNEKINWKPLAKPEDEVRWFCSTGNDLFILTTKENPNFNIIKTSFLNPDFQKAEIIAKGGPDWQISSQILNQSKDYLLYTKTKNELQGKQFAYNFNTGNTIELNVPLSGNIYSGSVDGSLGFSGDDNEILLFNLGWTVPFNIYSYDLDTHELSKGMFYTDYKFTGMDALSFEEVEVASHDGVLVPLSIVYNKHALKKDGSNIVFMEGYGSYGFSYIPHFRFNSLPLLNRGVILAFAHVRGGGEKGNDWYLAGKKSTKPNTWKDFNACAEWLIEHRYTSPDKFGISGASAGGILIGRAITERPDLYKVAIPKVGCLNALRFEFDPNGPANIPEFGTVEDSVEFLSLYEMDAYQHIRKGKKYPAQLITTGFNDPRVSSYTPAKFAAKMQAENASANPVFLDVDYRSGHFGGSTLDEGFLQAAREYAFLLWQTGHPEFQPSKQKSQD